MGYIELIWEYFWDWEYLESWGVFYVFGVFGGICIFDDTFAHLETEQKCSIRGTEAPPEAPKRGHFGHQGCPGPQPGCASEQKVGGTRHGGETGFH